MEVEGRKGDTILTGADELYHDEAFRAKASPFSPILNVNNFFEISICKPENFLTFPPTPYNSPRLFIGANAGSIPLLRVGIASSAGGGSSTMKDWTRFGQQAGSGKWSAARDDMSNGAGAQRRTPLADGSERFCVFDIPRKERAGGK